MAKFNDLYRAVKACDCARVRQLIQGGIDVDCRDSMKRTVLHHAADNFVGSSNKHVHEIKNVILTLVDLGADINACDIERRTPLYYSLDAGKTKRKIWALEFLVGLGADINARFDVSGNASSLHRAIQLNNIRGIEILLRLGVDVNAMNCINYTALQYMTFDEVHTSTKLMKRLVKLGADVNSGYTIFGPLLEAVELRRIDIIRILLQHGASVMSERFDNFTPVIHAVTQRNPEAVKILTQLGADLNAKLCISTTVNEIVKVKRVDILENLFRHGAEALSQGLKKITPLGLALNMDFHEMVDCLLKAGADVNAKYDEGISPLVTAVRLGDTDMVTALAKLEPQFIDLVPQSENCTLLHYACVKDPKTMKSLLKFGGDVNHKYDESGYAVHEAVRLGNGQMLRVLAECGANLNCKRAEGKSLIYFMIDLLNIDAEKAQKHMAMIKLLVEAHGLDLNQEYTRGIITPLHDALRLGNTDMVQILGELKADMNTTKNEMDRPIFHVIGNIKNDLIMTDMIRYFAQNTIDINSRMTMKVTPLHDAVRLGNVDMVRVLINSGASRESVKSIVTILHFAIAMRNNEAVKCLLECGADVNAKTSCNISALHDAAENSNLAMIYALRDCRNPKKAGQYTPIFESISNNNSDTTETLLKYGADLNCLQNICLTPLDVALYHGNIQCIQLLIGLNQRASGDQTGSSPLHAACQFGHIDLARLLIIEGSDVNKRDHNGKKPFEYLPLANTVDYHVLQEAVTVKAARVAARVTKRVPTSFVSVLGCEDMAVSLHTPGIGDVRFIPSPSATEISQRVNHLLESITQQCQRISGKKLKQVGSSAEGTRVGLPNEMDFLFGSQLVKDEERKIVDLGNGYVKYDFIMIQQLHPNRDDQNMISGFTHMTGSAGFHSKFIEEVMNRDIRYSQNAESDEKVSVTSQGSQRIRDTDRKACSLLSLRWNDGKSAFNIPVDIVPSLHIDNWPEGATTSTWLMDEQELRSRGYVLVPKPPHVKSELAKKCTEEEKQTLWKISFPHLETEHMQRLEQRVKDVYITAKCLRNPDVCRIMITDDGSLPRTVDKYVTSYLLKMCFFKNVKYFRQHGDLCLEEMVCRVYTELVVGLSNNFIPLFFLPKVSALSGIKVDVAKSAKVAKIMATFVRALYLRSVGESKDSCDDEATSSQPKPTSVYRIYDIST